MTSSGVYSALARWHGPPMRLSFADHRQDPARWAVELGISRAAVELYLACDVIDLHIDSFIWTRILGYDLKKRHGTGPTGGRFFSQVDLPRAREAQLKGALWCITTNPLRSADGRARAFQENLQELVGILKSCPEDVAVVRRRSEYDAAQKQGLHAAFVAIQGGNALAPEALDLIPDDLVVLVTLVHLSNSSLGATSSPLAAGNDGGLTAQGKEYIERLNQKRIIVDLAHISRRGFFEALPVHDKTQPLVVSHTGVSGVHVHWRNLDDEQLRAVAKTSGIVGVMYQQSFLAPGFSATAETVVRHLEHIVNVAGEDAAALGSDWDGAIIPPPDLRTCLELPRLVQVMLARGFSEERVRKIMGGNFLRVLSAIRP